jgi:DNA replication licensing factor MCM4
VHTVLSLTVLLSLPRLIEPLHRAAFCYDLPSDLEREADCDRRSPAAPAKTPRNRRGDIHSTLSLTPSRPPRTSRPRRAENGDPAALSSDVGFFLPSSQPQLSAAVQPTEEPDELRAIWGTTVNINNTMNVFKDFLKGFKPKYRIAHDRSQGLPTKASSSPEEVEEVLYETYMRRMRTTGQTNLNLDAINLLAYPPSKKLYTQLIKWPQEIVPTMDQTLKDYMLELAQQDQEDGLPDMEGQQGDEEIADIASKVYTIRPFGFPSVNMRDLNPSGMSDASPFTYFS